MFFDIIVEADTMIRMIDSHKTGVLQMLKRMLVILVLDSLGVVKLEGVRFKKVIIR